MKDDGTFEVTVYYDWSKRNGPYYDGRGTGRTFTEGASMSIQDAEGELEIWPQEAVTKVLEITDGAS